MVVGIALKFNRCIQCGALERCAIDRLSKKSAMQDMQCEAPAGLECRVQDQAQLLKVVDLGGIIEGGRYIGMRLIN